MISTQHSIEPIVVLFLLFLLPHSNAATLFSDGAENGTTQAIDGTQASYSLIQTDNVGYGNYAFHLANPDFEDSWFELDETFSVAPDTKLFFLSQLTAATEYQIATVQVSLDSGNSWPFDVYSQAGNGFPGEATFSLREIKLSPFEDQKVRFRFMFDFVGVSAFTQTDDRTGWFVDNIQVGDEVRKIQYSVGEPSDEEQLYLEVINRGREDALVEARRLAGETNPLVSSAYDLFNIDRDNIEKQFRWHAQNGCLDRYAQPLSFNSSLLRAAQLHSKDQLANAFQGHRSSSSPPEPFRTNDSFGQRLGRVGYDGFTSAAENVFASARSVEHGHAGFDTDWGTSADGNSDCHNPDFVGQGMQNPPGHRFNIHNDNFKEVGIGVASGTNEDVGPQIVTQEFADPGKVSFITGVVYNDLNNNLFYDLGEGKSEVRVDVQGSVFYANSSASGAYSIPVTADGSYLITFSEYGQQRFSKQVIMANGRNKKVDYPISASDILGDFNLDQRLDATDINLLTAHVLAQGNLTKFDLTGDDQVNGQDTEYWVDVAFGTFFGDANLDKKVDFTDFVELANSFSLPGNWSEGDFDGNAVVDFPDFSLLSNNYGLSATMAVPEPNSMPWMWFAFFLISLQERSDRRQ